MARAAIRQVVGLSTALLLGQGNALAGPPGAGSLAADVHRLEEARADYRATVEGLIHRAHQARKKDVEQAFEGVTRREDDAARVRRVAAIAQFEDFLRRFPSDARWTPDTLFRLAELYFEKAEEDYQYAWDAYNARARATTGELGPAPTKDYARPIELFRRLARDFPRYRQLDGALYLLGYCIDETGDHAAARQVFLGLVCTDQHAPLEEPAEPARGKGREDPYATCHSRWPESAALADAWMRLGEIDFDDNRFDPAAFAYRRVVERKPERLMELALYKIAWADYKLDRFASSVAAFDRVLAWGTEQRRLGKRTTNLQKEALQYLGLSLAEADWNGDGVEDVEAGLGRARRIYQGREAEPHVREVFVAMGEVYLQSGKLDLAVRLFEDVLRRWPSAPEAPTTHDRLVTSYERLRDFEHARLARDELVLRYGTGTAWAKANRGNPEAEQTARQISESNLERAAAAHHQRAQLLRRKLGMPPAAGPLADAQREYLAAAARYEELLARFPRSESRYERTYDLAEAYYFGGKLEHAAARYEEVRDWQGELRLREDAALGVLKSREDLLAGLLARGALQEPAVPTAGPVVKRTLEPAYEALQRAQDQYVARVGGPRTGPLSYAAAVIALRHGDLPEARRRLGAVVERFCKTHEGGLASDALVETYKLEADLGALGREAARLSGLACGTPDSQKVRQGELAALMNDVRFRTAERLQREGKCEEAGPLYLKLVDQAPRDKNADRALNNAAVCFETVHRYGEATRTYERIVREYASSELGEEALFRAAINHERFFEFEDAVAGYLALAEAPRYAKSPHRTQALGLAAQILFNDRQYVRAATLYQRFAKSGAAPGDAEAAAFRAALALERARKPADAAAALRAFLRDHAGGTGETAGGRVVAAAFKLGEALAAQKDEKGADKAFRRAVKEWSDRKLPAAGEAADFAARVVFARADRRFEEFVKLPLKSKTQKALETSVSEQLKLVRTLAGEFDRVLAYGRAGWSLAALHKQAELYFQLGQKLLKAPVPAALAKKLGPEAEEIYREQLEQALRPLEQKAQEHWEKVVRRGAELGVANEWTRRARQRLNAFRPDEFPVLRLERVALELEAAP